MFALWPLQRFELHSPLAPEEAMRRLSEEMIPAQRWWKILESRKFRPEDGSLISGRISENRFRLVRYTSYGSDSRWFPPRIRGIVLPAGEGCVIRGTIWMHWSNIAFYLLCLGLALWASLTFFSETGNCESPCTPVIVSFIYFALVVFAGPFHFGMDIRHTKEHLSELFGIPKSV